MSPEACCSYTYTHTNRLDRLKLTILCVDERLGLSIAPEDVRLITNREDQYKWVYLPCAQYLFTKQLSKHTLKVYTEMFAMIGATFEAVPNDCSSGPLQDDLVSALNGYVPLIRLTHDRTV